VSDQYLFHRGNGVATPTLKLIWLFLLTLGASGCAAVAANPPATPADETPIGLGVVTSLSGSLAMFGQAHLQGYDLALQEINDAGGVLGRPVRLLFEDDASDPAMAATAVEKLAAIDQVPLILGSYSSSATLLAAGMAERHQVPLIIPTAAADEITRQGYRWIFRINAPSAVYIETLLDFLDEVAPPSRLAIVFENTGFGTSVAEAAERQARARAINVVAYHAYRTGAGDFRPLLAEVKASRPDVVIFVSYLEDAVALMVQSRELGFNPGIFAAAGAGFGLPDFPLLAGAAAEFTVSVTQWTPDVGWPGAAAFAGRFQAKYGRLPQYHSAQAYAALLLAADALSRAGSLEQEAIRQSLQRTDLLTIFGPIRFDAQGQNDHPMLVTQMIHGRFVTVYPPEVAVQRAVYPVPAWNERLLESRLEESTSEDRSPERNP
jgi:branched-chain amino acid transport system substrate-binding protein